MGCPSWTPPASDFFVREGRGGEQDVFCWRLGRHDWATELRRLDDVEGFEFGGRQEASSAEQAFSLLSFDCFRINLCAEMSGWLTA